MRRALRIRGAGLGFAACVLLAPALSGATETEADKARCEASYESAQRLKREEHLSATKAQLAICIETCPAPLVADCTAWLKDLEVLLPTVRLVARTATGAAARDVRVTMDGSSLTGSLDGRPITVEPGAHVFRFQRDGEGLTDVRAEIHQGERDHLVEAVLPSAPKPVRSSATEPSHTPSWVLGGAGVLALATAAGLTIKGHLDRSSLRSSCYPYCREDQVDAIRSTWLAAGIVAGAGALSLLAAILLWPKAPRNTALSWRLP